MRKISVMVPYQEIGGPFNGLEERDGVLLLEIGKHIIALPLELKESLSPLLGSRIAVIRTDIPGTEYVVRILGESQPDIKQTTGVHYDNERISEGV